MKQQNRRGYIYQVVDQELYALNKHTPLYECEFSVRTWNALKQSGLETVSDLLGMKEADILKIKNFGRLSLQELNRLLSLDYGVEPIQPPRMKNKCINCGRPCIRSYCSLECYFTKKRELNKATSIGNERNMMILDYKKAGKSLSDIGKIFGLSKQRVSQIIKESQEQK